MWRRFKSLSVQQSVRHRLGLTSVTPSWEKSTAESARREGGKSFRRVTSNCGLFSSLECCKNVLWLNLRSVWSGPGQMCNLILKDSLWGNKKVDLRHIVQTPFFFLMLQKGYCGKKKKESHKVVFIISNFFFFSCTVVTILLLICRFFYWPFFKYIWDVSLASKSFWLFLLHFSLNVKCVTVLLIHLSYFSLINNYLISLYDLRNSPLSSVALTHHRDTSWNLKP